MQSPYLNSVTTEILRLCNPLPGIVPRVLVKDYEFNGVKAKKGDLLSISIQPNFMREEFFENPEEFKPSRHEDQKTANNVNVFTPFHSGKRGCIGKKLGEIMVKLVVTELVKRFEITKPEGFVRNLIIVPTLTVESCKLRVRLR